MVNIDLSIEQKHYGQSDQLVLKSVFCSIPSGQFVALVGPSGTGKTTLLNMIAGLEVGEVNSVMVGGQCVQENKGCKVGYIFQQPRLMPWMTVTENLKLIVPDATLDQVEDMLLAVGLEKQGSRYPRQLSGGMQKRVSIARAFLTQPDLLLLDEPFVSLDLPTAAHLRNMLESLWLKHRPTVVFVSHDLDEAICLADRILFLSSPPGSLLLDHTVELERPRSGAEGSGLVWKQQLLSNYPDLLAGCI